MIVEALQIPKEDRQSYERAGRVILVANHVQLEQYLRELNIILQNPTTVRVHLNTRDIHALLGSARISPGELITDGRVTDIREDGLRTTVEEATYVGWVGTMRWELAPSDYFITTSLNSPKFRGVARMAEASNLLFQLVLRDDIRGDSNGSLPAISYPFKYLGG
ncbi:hypothetical protein HYS94_05545 [Candidatus Daviesbacteria bacterium]|nr:hypothetical protein [Candidatus Daviesbacteria bacterium]